MPKFPWRVSMEQECQLSARWVSICSTFTTFPSVLASHLSVDFESGRSCLNCGPGACGCHTTSGAPDVGCITCLNSTSALTTSLYTTFQIFDADRVHLPILCPGRVTLFGLFSPLHLPGGECQSFPVSMFLEQRMDPLESRG